jgi:hypothetical protein
LLCHRENMKNCDHNSGKIAASMVVVIVISLLFLFSPASTQAQGTFNFHNLPPVPDAPVYDLDGVTRLSGPRYQALLYAGPEPSSLVPVGRSVSFLTGEGAGYFVGGDRQLHTVLPGQITFIEVRVWDTATADTWEQAAIRGASPMFSLLAGSPSRPGHPATLVGLASFQLIPEPSTLLLSSLVPVLILSRYIFRFLPRNHWVRKMRSDRISDLISSRKPLLPTARLSVPAIKGVKCPVN